MAGRTGGVAVRETVSSRVRVRRGRESVQGSGRTAGRTGGAAEKTKAGAGSHEEEWTVRWRKPRDISSEAEAKWGTEGALTRVEAAAEGRRSQVLAWLRAEAAESNRQPAGRPKVASARVMGKSRFSARLCMELDRREMMTSKSQSMGRPKMVLTVTSEPRANEMVMGEPEMSV